MFSAMLAGQGESGVALAENSAAPNVEANGETFSRIAGALDDAGQDVLRGRGARLEEVLRSDPARPQARESVSMGAAPGGTSTTGELIRAAVVLGTCATFVTTVALLTGWGVATSLFGKCEMRERPEDWDFDP